jgi:hypothetical protein
VVQRRVRPVPELFAVDDGDPVPWIVNWGVFTVVNGYGGAFARAATVKSNVEVIHLFEEVYAGCGLHEADPGDRSTPTDPVRPPSYRSGRTGGT